MSVFTVDLANQPGELARLCEAMAGRGINLVLSAIAREDGGTVAFIADDEAGAQEVLDGAGLQYAMRPALTIRMENQPGTGAATFRKLANAGVNADLLLPVRVSDALFFAVICVDDQDKARQALGAQVIPPGSRPVALAAVLGPGPGRSPPLPRSQRHRSYPGTRRRDRLSSRPPGSRQCLTTETDRRTAATANHRAHDGSAPPPRRIEYVHAGIAAVCGRSGRRSSHSVRLAEPVLHLARHSRNGPGARTGHRSRPGQARHPCCPSRPAAKLGVLAVNAGHARGRQAASDFPASARTVYPRRGQQGDPAPSRPSRVCRS